MQPQGKAHPQVRPPQEPCTSGFSSPSIDATLRHPGQSAFNPTLVYTTVRHAPLATPNWQWELQNRKWRANAEHIVKLERLDCIDPFIIFYLCVRACFNHFPTISCNLLLKKDLAYSTFASDRFEV